MSRLKGVFFKSSPAQRGVLILSTISALLLTQLALAADHASVLPPEKHTLILDQAIQFKPESYTDGTPKDLTKALIEYKQKKEQQAKQIQIDLKGALAEIDKPIANNVSLNKATAQALNILEVRSKALKNNLAIEVSQLDPAMASASLRQEQAKFDNIIFAYAKKTGLDSPKNAGNLAGFSSTNPSLDGQQVKITNLAQSVETLDIVAGVKVPLRSGGSVTLSSPLENKKTAGAFSSDEYNSALRFSVSQPLLRNAGTQVNEASIRVAEFDKQAIQLKTKLQAIRIIALTDKAYWGLYEAWAQLDIRNQQYQLAIQNLTMVRQRVNEGLTAAIELNRAEIGVADRMEALIVAETNLKLAQRQLRFFMNDMESEQENPPVINTTTEPNLLRYEFDRNKLIQDALNGRLDLLELELKLSAEAVNIQYFENQTLPLFSLDYHYGALSSSANNLGNSYQNVFNGQFNEWAIGLKFEMPFTNEANKAKLDYAVQQRNKSLATKRLQTLTVKKEIYDALDQVENNWQRILAARQQVVIAGYNYDAELKQFNEGLRTMTEVLETLTRLGEAQIKEVKAVSDYQVSMIDIAYATGTIFGYSKLDIN
jgi:outer membrane protein